MHLLNYAKKVRRRPVPKAIFVLVVATALIGLVAVKRSDDVLRRFRIMRLQDALDTSSLMNPAYWEGKSDELGLKGNENYYSVSNAFPYSLAYKSSNFVDFKRIALVEGVRDYNWPVFFAGIRRATPSSPGRIVVGFFEIYGAGHSRVLTIRTFVCSESSFFQESRARVLQDPALNPIGFELPREVALRISFGVADAADDARIIVEYQCGTLGHISLKLLADDSIMVQPIDGPLKMIP